MPTIVSDPRESTKLLPPPYPLPLEVDDVDVRNARRASAQRAVSAAAVLTFVTALCGVGRVVTAMSRTP